MSNQRFKFYVVFVIDYSRFCWFYPMHNKSEFTFIFFGFQKLVENEYNTKIKMLQTDGGGEFMNTKLRDHLVTVIYNTVSHAHTLHNKIGSLEGNIGISLS